MTDPILQRRLLIESQRMNKEFRDALDERDRALAQWKAHAESLEHRLTVVTRERDAAYELVQELAEEPFMATPDVTERAKELVRRAS